MRLFRLAGIYLSALVLGMAFAGSVQAGFHSYEGELTVQATSGSDCKDTPVGSVRKVRLHIQEEGSPQRFEGYLEGEGISTGHILGDRLDALEVIYPFADEALAKGHSLKLSGTGSDSVVGELRETSLPADAQNCNYDQAALKLARAKGIQAKVVFGATAGRFNADRLSFKADLLERSARYSDALLIRQELVALHEQTLGPEHSTTGASLSNLASLYHQMGQYAKAEPLYMRALAIAEQVYGPEHPETGTKLNNLAALYQYTARYARAEPLYVRALAIIEKVGGPENYKVGVTLSNLAVLYELMGQYAKAEPLHIRALAITEKSRGSEHPSTGLRLNNLSELYKRMGQYAKAEPLHVRALAIAEKAQGPEHPDTGTFLSGLGALYYAMGLYAKAEPLYVRALAIAEKAQGPEHPETGVTLDKLALLYKSTGQYAKAEPLYIRALAIAEKSQGPEHPDTGTTLSNLAMLYKSMGQYAKAEPLARRAYLIALNAGDPNLLRHTQATLSTLLEKQNQPEAAIFFGKQAVNTLQSMRSEVAKLGKETLKSYDTTIDSTYRHLSRLLIASSRLVEAERVLELLKEQEQFEFVRRSAGAGAAGKAPLTSVESSQDQLLERAGAPLAKLHAERVALEDKETRSADEEVRLQAVLKALDQAKADFQRAFEKVLSTLAATRRDKVEDIKEAQGLQDTLRELSEISGEKVVALYTVVDREGYSLVLTSADYRRVYTVPIKAEALNKKINDWREAIKDQLPSHFTLGRELLDIILPPAAREELQQAQVGTLMWHLDGALRLLPLAALHDGKQYLIERYRLATFTQASLDKLKDAPKARWSGLGLGVSNDRTVGTERFKALPAAAKELRAVIRQNDSEGIIPGNMHLNDEFNWARMQEQLKRKGRFPLVHVASHFHLVPGNDTMSFLLPGTGEPITLALLNQQANFFGGVDLLTLSACETAIGDSEAGTGREIDGLSSIAQRQGAKSVVATLWPVADESTGLFMQTFYRVREEQKLTKAEALRQAQLALLTGKVGSGGTAKRPPYAHPYFWAPFILMGNWL